MLFFIESLLTLSFLVVVNEDEILPIMEEEFPHIYLSPHTAKMIWQKQMRQVNHLSKVGRSYRNSSTKAKQRFDEAQKKQELLTRIMKKELAHSERLVSKIYNPLINC